jgi:hypothetical protein
MKKEKRMIKMKYTVASKIVLSASILLTTFGSSTAREVTGLPDAPGGRTGKGNFYKMAAGCEPATAQVDLDINNVRTRILNGGDMWWDLLNAKYEIPKVLDRNTQVSKNALFSGALWIGGLSQGNLKLAAQTYRQSGNDFFPGPLSTTTSSVTPERCKYYDKIVKVTREEIDAFIESPDKSSPPSSIEDWPAHGNLAYGESDYLAPFVNVGGTLRYEPQLGDYPDVFGDQTLWWVYNDRGNIHSETQGVPIGLELQTQAFAFATNDEINNMTFYTTTIFNRSNEDVDSCYFGQWVDADLGNYTDDYVGCDVPRSLGICYNGDEDDEGVLGYGSNPPSVGVDFFEGPFADLNDGKDNDYDGITDEPGEKIGLSKFMYYNNDNSADRGNPFSPQHYYNYLRGIWKDGVIMTYGGNGKGGGLGSSNVQCNFMFPGSTDPVLYSQLGEWTELTAGNPPADRRFLQSAGAFKLKAGAVNKVTVGVVWARVSQGGATGSLELLKRADDKAQKLFNNNFEIVDGPNAPDLNVVELNRELIINLENTTTSKVEKYSDTVVGAGGNNIIYKFEGYQVYQLKDQSVSTGELDDVDRARLVFQCDELNDVANIVNVVFDPSINDNNKVLKVNANNKGVTHSVRIQKDLFARGDQTLVNFKTYYYLVISYAHATNDPNDPDQYLAGRNNVQVYSATPHPSQPRSGGLQVNAGYGTGPKLTRIVGTGNGGNSLALTQKSIDQILKDGKMANPTYVNGRGPVDVKVIDPTKVPAGEFELHLVDASSRNDTMAAPLTRWFLVKKSGTKSDTVYSDTSISVRNEQIVKYKTATGKIEDWGMSVTIKQSMRPGNTTDLYDQSNGFISGTMEFADDSKTWLTGVPDVDNNTITTLYQLNWIRSGIFGRNEQFSPAGTGAYLFDFGSGTDGLDPKEKYEKILGGRIAPYRLASSAVRNTLGQNSYGPAWDKFRTDARLSDLASVELVLTSDTSKWTQCVVVELCEDAALSEGGARKMDMRRHQSVDKMGNPVADPNDIGRGWFPGYAINMETGERLNIMFGEDSYFDGDNGKDMIWNPTSSFFNGQTVTPIYGGKHFIYVMGSKTFGTFNGPTYDGGLAYQAIFKTTNFAPTDIEKRKVYSQPLWVMMSYLQSGFKLLSPQEGIIPTDVRISLNIQKPYAKFNPDPSNTTPLNQAMPVYKFNTNDIQALASAELGKKALDMVNIVPNPYYGYSAYESSQLDTRVKFTNLPPKCTISIYTLNGVLVRRIKKDDPTTTSVDWDIRNQANVPIASGVYIIHVDAGPLGEKILKWFGVMRQYDLDSF